MNSCLNIHETINCNFPPTMDYFIEKITYYLPEIEKHKHKNMGTNETCVCFLSKWKYFYTRTRGDQIVRAKENNSSCMNFVFNLSIKYCNRDSANLVSFCSSFMCFHLNHFSNELFKKILRYISFCKVIKIITFKLLSFKTNIWHYSTNESIVLSFIGKEKSIIKIQAGQGIKLHFCCFRGLTLFWTVLKPN